jgi:hypothetical protein
MSKDTYSALDEVSLASILNAQMYLCYLLCRVILLFFWSFAPKLSHPLSRESKFMCGCDVYYACSGFRQQMAYLENRKELCGATHIGILFKKSTIDSCWCSVHTGHLTKPKTQNLSEGSYNAMDLIIRFLR